jgi:Cu+-exporting ATPase
MAAITGDTAATPVESRIELSIGGMTCASCAARIEKRLNKLDGVTATVNYATEKATVDYSAEVDPSELVAQVEGPATPPTSPHRPTPTPDPSRARTTRWHHCGNGC